MKKTIIIIASVILALIIICAFVVNPFITEYREQTIISDCEYSTGINLPSGIKPLKGSYTICYPEDKPVIWSYVISEISKKEYEFIKNQAIELNYDKKMGSITDTSIENRLIKCGWQNEEYEIFREVGKYELSYLHRWDKEQLIIFYKKSEDVYAFLISGTTDFNEYRDIEL